MAAESQRIWHVCMVYRAGMFAAVKERAPALLLFTQWAYSTGTPPHINGAPEDVAPVLCQLGVRQGDPLGALLFALTLQPVFDHIGASDAATPVVACLDDIRIAGGLAAGAAVFRRLCVDADDVCSIGLELNLANGSVYSVGAVDAAAVVAVAVKLGIRDLHVELKAVGLPLGTSEYVAEALVACAREVEGVVETIVQIQLSVQAQFLFFYVYPSVQGYKLQVKPVKCLLWS